MKKLTTILTVLALSAFLMAGSAMADSINTNRPITPGTSTEPSLQNIFNGIFTVGSLDAIDDQSNAALWNTDENDTDAYLIAAYRGDQGTLGIYSASTGATYDFVLTGGYTASFWILNDNSIEIRDGLGTRIFSNFGKTFGFYWHNTSVANPLKSYTEDSKNPNNTALALAYLLDDGMQAVVNNRTYKARSNNDWIIAFEDRLSGDFDYNDAVFWMEDMKAVPEPATMLLLGTSLLGLVAVGRRKFFKK